MTYDLYQLSKVRAKEGPLKQSIGEGKRKRTSGVTSPVHDIRTVEDVFVESLVAAGECRHQAAAEKRDICTRPIRRPIRPSRHQWTPVVATGRHFTTTSSAIQTVAPAVPASREISREEYTELVYTYDSPAFIEPVHRKKEVEHVPLAPRLVVPPEQEDKPPFARRAVVLPQDLEHGSELDHFRQLLNRRPGHVSLPKLWDTYQELRAPRPRYLHDSEIRKFFQHLAWVQFKHGEGASLRYNTFLDECLGEEIHVTTAEWNTATSFAGRWVRNATTAEVRRAVESWVRMESFNVQADSVTFNILFDVAVKAGRFALADTIYHELKARGLPLNRYFRNSMIYYAGLRGDGDAVRQAFRDLVSAGELVDTAVMNCVILSLIRAGEPSAAENVYAKMKRLHREKFADTVPPKHWQERKELGISLDKTARRLRQERDEHESSFFGSGVTFDDKREELQKIAPIAPDVRTCRILIQHHAYTSGRLNQIHELMAEMKAESCNIYGSVYLHIFRGFWHHGGQAYAAWNRKELQLFWMEFLAMSELDTADQTADQVDEYAPEISETERAPYFTPSLAIAALRAFYKCAGTKRMLEVWREIRERWRDMDGEDTLHVQTTVDKLCRADSVYVT